MFTSRAEFRTLLRQDNADLRLTEKSYRIGLASQERMERVRLKEISIIRLAEVLSSLDMEPHEINDYLVSINSATLTQRQKAAQLLLRPGVDLPSLISNVASVGAAFKDVKSNIIEQLEIQVKYDVYIQKEKELVTRMGTLEDQVIPDTFDYTKLNSLSNEARQKFMKIRPQTLGQASRISGVNPSDVQILMVYMGR
jgi:tRNA uridine 5-carboxymethylaminomethyl modification enzyme